MKCPVYRHHWGPECNIFFCKAGITTCRPSSFSCWLETRPSLRVPAWILCELSLDMSCSWHSGVKNSQLWFWQMINAVYRCAQSCGIRLGTNYICRNTATFADIRSAANISGKVLFYNAFKCKIGCLHIHFVPNQLLSYVCDWFDDWYFAKTTNCAIRWCAKPPWGPHYDLYCRHLTHMYNVHTRLTMHVADNIIDVGSCSWQLYLWWCIHWRSLGK